MADQFDQLPINPPAESAAILPPQPQMADMLQPAHEDAVNDFLKEDLNEEKYGGLGQQAITGLEGAAEGVAGPLAPIAEKALGVNPKDILARKETNPITHGVGQAVGLGGSMLLGDDVGLAGAMTKVGKGAEELTGLAKAAGAVSEFGPQVPSFVAKVGSEAVKQAAEMAVLTSSDEVTKAILGDPSAGAENAIANIGLSSALGAGTGALFAGAVSPLWHATAGPKVDEFLTTLTNHLNGSSKVQMPAGVQQAFTDLAIEPHPVMKAALSGDPKALTMAQDLYRAQNPEFLAHLNALPDQVKNVVADGLGVSLDDAAVFSNKESGDAVREAFINRIDREYGPIADALNARDAEAATIAVPDEARLDFGNRIMAKAVGPEVGTDSPIYKEYEHYANRVLAKDNIRGLDKLSTELYDKATSMSTDKGTKNALFDIRRMINEFKEQQISSQAKRIGEGMVDAEGIKREIVDAAKEYNGPGAGGTRKGKAAFAKQAEAIGDVEAKTALEAGRAEGKELGAHVLNLRAEVGRNYAEYADKMNEMTSHLGVGDFKGTGTLKSKLEDLTSEKLLSKFATKGDADSQKFLVENFPEVAQLVKEHEAKKFLSPSIHEHMGETTLDLKNLTKRLESLKKGSPEHAAWVLNPGAAEKIQSAKVIQDAISQIKGIKDSGTPGGLGRVFKHVGAGALGAVGFLMGHNPVSGAIVGELAQRLSKDAPEAIKLGLLKFMGNDQPVNAAGMKAMVDYIHAATKGEVALVKATKAVFKASSDVLKADLIPGQRDREKLDKTVTQLQEHPDKVAQRAGSGQLGHYMPDHQAALTQASTSALQYLQQLKPRPFQPSPLDRPIDPTPAQTARYNRALDIAQQPLVVMQHIKDGTLQMTDLQDLKAMYPTMYTRIAQKLTSEMIGKHANEEPIPYKTKLGLSLFLGQPLDSSMMPNNIMAAQPMPASQPPQTPSQGAKPTTKASTTMNKNAKSFQTASQQAESDRSSRD